MEQFAEGEFAKEELEGIIQIALEMHRKGLNEIHTSRKSEKHIARWRKLCYIVDMGKP